MWRTTVRFMRSHASFQLGLLLLCGVIYSSEGYADVVVIANRTREQITITTMPQEAKSRQVTIAQDEVLPIPTEGKLPIRFVLGSNPVEFVLDANSVYYFGPARDGKIDLQKIGLGGDDRTRAGRTLPGSDASTPVASIRVKILVDEDEYFKRDAWEKRLRKRVEDASEILEKHSRVRLKVVAVETWESDDDLVDFVQSLAELKEEIDLGPAQLVIGFTSQYQLGVHRGRLGGIYGPLRRHILVRERSARDISESERLEVLVHELGHYLGAAHSPELNTVMRPILGDRQARSSRFALRFDPVNTLVMYMIGEELRRRSVTMFSELLPTTKERLAQVYRELLRANPKDPTAQKYLQLCGG